MPEYILVYEQNSPTASYPALEEILSFRCLIQPLTSNTWIITTEECARTIGSALESAVNDGDSYAVIRILTGDCRHYGLGLYGESALGIANGSCRSE